MNSLIWTVAGVVFIFSFLIGWALKRFRWLFLPIILSLPVSFGVWLLAIQMPEMAKAGLGIIALGPVILIIMGFVNLIAAIVGGLIGTIVGKKLR